MTSVDEESDLFDTSSLTDTTDTVSLTVELPRALVERLQALVARSEWNASIFVHEALANYIPVQERQMAEIEEAIAEIDAGAAMIPHEEIVAWVKSRGTPTELPRPGR